MVLVDDGNVIVDANPALLEMLGYGLDELAGRPLAKALHAPGTSDRHAELFAQIRQTGTGSGERTLRRKDGRTVTVQFAAFRGVVGERELYLAVAIRSRLHPVEIETPASDVRQELTRREIEIISQIAMGRTATQIADDLFLSPHTVRTHVARALRKAGASSQAQLVAIAMVKGLIDPDSVTKPPRS